MHKLRNYIKYVLLSLPIFMSTRNQIIAQAFCEEAMSNGVDFTCSDITIPYQPCDENFELIRGKATTATMLWLLGERHSLRDKTANCIERLTENVGEHRIYLESVESGKEIPCEKMGIKQKNGRKCLGWDDLAIEKKALSFFPNSLVEVYFSYFESAYKKGMISSTLLDQTLKKIEKFNPADPGDMDSIKKMRDLLLERRMRGDSYDKIFSEKDRFLGTEMNTQQANEFQSLNKKRNKKLLHTLNNTSHKLFSIVVGGAAHMAAHDSFDTGAAEHLNDELQKSKHQNSYAVLVIKRESGI